MTSLDLPALVSIAAFSMAFVIFTDLTFQRLAKESRGTAPIASRQS